MQIRVHDYNQKLKKTIEGISEMTLTESSSKDSDSRLVTVRYRTYGGQVGVVAADAIDLNEWSE